VARPAEEILHSLFPIFLPALREVRDFCVGDYGERSESFGCQRTDASRRASKGRGRVISGVGRSVAHGVHWLGLVEAVIEDAHVESLGHRQLHIVVLQGFRTLVYVQGSRS